jgi:hypothetical protein
MWQWHEIHVVSTALLSSACFPARAFALVRKSTRVLLLLHRACIALRVHSSGQEVANALRLHCCWCVSLVDALAD